MSLANEGRLISPTTGGVVSTFMTVSLNIRKEGGEDAFFTVEMLIVSARMFGVDFDRNFGFGFGFAEAGGETSVNL
jgi:hypothetical protein